jgi:hypothetical protein
MKSSQPRFIFAIVVALSGYSASAQDSEKEVETGERDWSQLEPPASCVCPKEGRWEGQNLEGWMDCTGPVNFKKTLGNEPTDRGTIWILEDDCSSVFGEAEKKKREDMLMHQVEDCSFFGTINGEEDGISMVIEVKWVAESDEFIQGEMHSNPSMQGMFCEYYRPYELTFREPIKEKDYEKARREMEKKLEIARQEN